MFSDKYQYLGYTKKWHINYQSNKNPWQTVKLYIIEIPGSLVDTPGVPTLLELQTNM